MKKLDYLKDVQKEVSLLISVDSKGGIVMSINAMFPIARIKRDVYIPNEITGHQELISLVQSNDN